MDELFKGDDTGLGGILIFGIHLQDIEAAQRSFLGRLEELELGGYVETIAGPDILNVAARILLKTFLCRG
jgi:hypothetical protein